MIFCYDAKELSRHPLVLSVDRTRLVLKTDFRIKLFELWREGRKDYEIWAELKRNGLGPERVGVNYVDKLIQSFRSCGYPLYKSDELKLRWDKINDNPLIRSGKFERSNHRGGIRIKPEFENELFLRYPEISVEDGIKLAGLDLLDLGYQRVNKIKNTLELRAVRLHAGMETEGGVPCSRQEKHTVTDERILRELSHHPYVMDVEGDVITLRDSFYNETVLLADKGAETLLEAYELPKELFKGRVLDFINKKLLYWKPTESEADGNSALLRRIQRRRIALMRDSVAGNFRDFRNRLADLGIEGRRSLARWIDSLPRDPWGYYTTGRILEEIGLPKSTYYELLNNENYGMSVRRRQARDDEDILLIRQVADYKGFAKGYRQISMMMKHVTGKELSEHRVLYLMRKYGMRTNIRKPSKNRKAMKELMRRNGKENLVMRRFRLHRPNEVRLTDVTYLDYGAGLRAYGSASIDPVTGRLICFVVSENNDLRLALDTLEAMDSCPALNGGIIHSDQGILYFTDDFQAAVKERDLVQSMSRRGNCWDNAPQESFFGQFKVESGYTKCRTLKELREKVQEYGLYYNEERRIRSRMKMTPVEYEAYLTSLDDGAFAAYMKAEEEKYQKKKEEAAARAERCARERKEAAAARLEELANETGRQEG